MRILFVITGLVSGGAEKLINDMLPIINGLDGYECQLLVLSDKDERYLQQLLDNGVRVTVVPEKVKHPFGRIMYILKFIKNGCFDVVHVNLFPAIYYLALVKWILGAKSPKLLMTEHNTDNRRRHYKIFRLVEKFVYKSYDGVICISEETKNKLVEWVRPVRTEKYVTIENGIQLHRFISASAYARKELGVPISENDVLLCMVASFTEQKNHDMAIEVMRLLDDRYKLLLVGEGVRLEYIKQIVEKDNLCDRVFFMGYRNDIPEIIKSSDVFILTSRWEGFGLVAVEAMASSIPIVSTDVKGVSEVIGNAGIKVPLDDIEAFAEGIIEITKADNYMLYSQKAVEQAKKYDIIRMINRYCIFFEEVLNGEIIR